jgi:SPP1 gp7 family putative phage head morphogenesis protein
VADDRWDFGPGPDNRATGFLAAKGVQQSWRWPSMWEDEHAFGFTLAGVYRMDVLAAAQELVVGAVRDGQSLGQFQAAFVQRMAALGFHGPQLVTEFEDGPREVNLTRPARMRVIYDTNVKQAYAASDWAAIQDTKADFPALEYAGVDDEVTRASHRILFGIVLPVDHWFWSIYFPPNDWFCRCLALQVAAAALVSGAVQITSDAELARRGITQDPADWPIWTHAETGRSVPVPKNVGPGFAYNAGMARRANLADLVAGRLDTLHPDLARAAAADLANLPQFRDLVEDAAAGLATAAEAWPIAVAPPALRGLDAGMRPAIRVGAQALAEAGLPAEDWAGVQAVLQLGEMTDLGAAGVEFVYAPGPGEVGNGSLAWRVKLRRDGDSWRIERFEPTSR